MKSIELFAGAGGLAMGMAEAGFEHAAVVERDRDACQTIDENRRHYKAHGNEFTLFPDDARNFDYDRYAGQIDVVSGGPPCQPFSLGGKHRGHMDSRDLFPVAADVVGRVMPSAFIFENVKGLLRRSFATYFEYILLQLSYPQVPRQPLECWEEHLARLEKAHTGATKPEYNVVFRLLNAADYGVPQKRERVVIVGFRHDLDVRWAFPEPTHSEDELFVSQWVTGDYWDLHRIAKKDRPDRPQRMERRIARLSNRAFDACALKPWVTVRDSLSDLPDPERIRDSDIPNHTVNAGARSYPGHTGSPIDEPSKALKAGDHGVPGGENMLRRPDGSIRYFTVREAARLQTFADEYVFHGSWSEAMRQLGNAVPVRLGQVVASSVAGVLGRNGRSTEPTSDGRVRDPYGSSA